MKSKILASIALASACVANAVTVSSVTARQRWPWSAMMDIDFTLIAGDYLGFVPLAIDAVRRP